MSWRSKLRGDVLGGIAGGLIVAAVVWLTLPTSAPRVTPIADRFGLAEGFEQRRDQEFAFYPQRFAVANGREDNARRNVRLWEAGQKLRGGHAPNIPQQTGDCVSWGGANALRIRLELKGLRADPSTMYLYGLARVVIGRNSPGCNQSGAFPSDLIDGIKTNGLITTEEAGVPYSGSEAKKWGCKGPPARLLELGRSRPCDAHPIRSTDELVDALCNGFPCTIGSLFGVRDGSIRVRDGRQVAEWNDRWAHQMCLCAYDGSIGQGREYVYVLNSWGHQAHPEPLQDEPPGGFWVSLKTAGRMIKDGECWAISDVRGFDNEIDWSVFDSVAVPRQSPTIRLARNEVHNARVPAKYTLAP